MSNEEYEQGKKPSYPLGQIYFYLTEGCNLCCRHCWIKPKFQDDSHTYSALNLDLFHSIIKQAKPLGLHGVKLSGGEPLLHPRIHEILEFIKKEDLTLSIETNGTLCTPRLSQAIASCKNASVAISLDSVEAETHDWIRGVKGSFSAAKEGINSVVKAGLKPQIIMTLMQCNKDQVEAMIRLAETLGAGSVKFNIVQPTARGKKMHEGGETLSIKELVETGEWVENVLSSKTRIRLHYSFPLAFRPLGKMYGNNGGSCSVCAIFNILGVLSDGSYALCGIGETVPEFLFGNAQTCSLSDIWDRTPVLLKIRNGLPEQLKGICGKCIMKWRCQGCCIAQNFYKARDLWSPYWFCEEAYDNGLFPETRIIPEKVINNSLKFKKEITHIKK